MTLGQAEVEGLAEDEVKLMSEKCVCMLCDMHLQVVVERDNLQRSPGTLLAGV